MHPARLILPVLIAALFAAATPNLASAQPLADRIPADAIVYLGWAGSDELGEAYEGSHLKGLLDAWTPREAIERVLGPLMQAEGDERAADAMRLAVRAGAVLFERPAAFYFGGVEFGRDAPAPIVRLAIVCEAGDRAGELRRIHEEVRDLADAPAEDVPFRLFEGPDGLIILYAEGMDPAALARLGVEEGPAQGAEPRAALADEDPFRRSLGMTIDRPAAAAYVSFAALWDLVDTGIGREGQDVAMWHTVRDALGLAGLKRAIWTGGFDGPDWATAAWAEAPAPRRGLLSLLDAEPLDDAARTMPPRTATWFTAARLDPAKFLPVIREVVTGVDPGAADELDEAMESAREMIGLDIQRDVLEALGDQWLVYGDFSVAGPMGMGFLLVNWLRDGDRLSDSLDVLEQQANDMLDAQREQLGLMFRIERIDADGMTIRYFNFPMFSPAWAVHEGRLMAAISPQAIRGRIGMDRMNVADITAKPEFDALVERLGRERVERAVLLSFADLPRTAPQLYQQLGAFLQMIAMQVPAPVDPMQALPPLEALLPHLSPYAEVAWLDETGLHQRGISPFPGADVLSPSGGMSTTSVAAVSMLTGIFLPAAARGREAARRAVSATHLRAIGHGMFDYADRHDGDFPPDLGTLVREGMVGPDRLLNPRLGTELPRDFLPFDELADWANDNSDYIYRGAQMTIHSPPDEIVAYERITPDLPDGINILFADGRVQFTDMDRAIDLLEQAGEDPPLD